MMQQCCHRHLLALSMLGVAAGPVQVLTAAAAQATEAQVGVFVSYEARAGLLWCLACMQCQSQAIALMWLQHVLVLW
jgi:hypothetical protein